jgi:hypothetical protein
MNVLRQTPRRFLLLLWTQLGVAATVAALELRRLRADCRMWPGAVEGWGLETGETHQPHLMRAGGSCSGPQPA